MKKNKILKLMLLSLMALPLASCGGETSTSSSGTSTPNEIKDFVPGGTNVKSDYTKAKKLRIYYYKFDEYYETNNFWAWVAAPTSLEGGRFSFNDGQIRLAHEDKKLWKFGEIDLTTSYNTTNWDGSKQCTVAFNGTQKPSSVGFIPRTTADKDDNFDRTIDLSYVDSEGVVTAFAVEGTTEFFYKLSDVPLGSLKKVWFDGTAPTWNKIRMASFSPVTSLKVDEVKVYSGDKEIAITQTNNKSQDNRTWEIVLERPITGDELGNTIKFEYNGLTKYVDVSFLYKSQTFNSLFTTDETLGTIYSKNATAFKVWSPFAKSIKLNLFKDDITEEKTVYNMIKGEKGVWSYTLQGDIHNTYYTYDIDLGSTKNYDVADPYAYSSGANGKRSLVVDMERTNPEGWEESSVPTINSFNDPIVYELHTRDLTSSSTWSGPKEHKGKFLGLIDEGTTYNGKKTGFDYIKDLGVSHVQLLPIYDYNSVDETKIDDPDYAQNATNGIFNWGYDPQGYNSLEGSYSSNPHDGLTRIKEFKQVVKEYNNANIGIIMDVVYNHMPSQDKSSFEKIFPGYYFNGKNDSGAGADMDSTKVMYKNFMVQSTSFWAKEYKLSGFRFDLMGLLTYDSMNELANKCRKDTNNDKFIIYGEGWKMGSVNNPANQDKAANLNNIGFFNDSFRDGAKGGVFDAESQGFVQSFGKASEVTNGYTGRYGWATGQNSRNEGVSVNYVEAHDNLTLKDKLELSTTNASDDLIKKMALQANGLVLTAQGLPFMHAGQEMLRSKTIPASDVATTGDKYEDKEKQLFYSGNSYNASDKVNGIDWSLVSKNSDMIESVKTLIKLRKEHQIFRTSTSIGLANDKDYQLIKDIASRMTFTHTSDEQVVAYKVSKQAGSTDSYNEIYVVHNAKSKSLLLDSELTNGSWNIAYSSEGITSSSPITSFTVGANSSVILYK